MLIGGTNWSFRRARRAERTQVARTASAGVTTLLSVGARPGDMLRRAADDDCRHRQMRVAAMLSSLDRIVDIGAIPGANQNGLW